MSLKNFMSYEDAATVLGEYADKVNELKSGLTNVADDVKLNTNDLTTPSRTKNVLPITVDKIKSFNTLGTWSDNTYTHNGIVFTINTDSAGNVVSINANGTAEPAASELNLYDNPYGYNKFKGCKLNGCTGGALGTFSLMTSYSNNGSAWANETHEYDGDIVVSESYNYVRFSIIIRHKSSVANKLFYPMIRPATITDPTFVPYIPSVNTRLDSVEKGNVSHEILKSSTGVWSGDTLTFTVAPENGRMWRLVAGVSYALGTKFVEAYIVIRAGESGVFTYNAHGTVTTTYDYTTGVLTVTLPESSHWIYRMELAAAYYD